MVCIYKSFPARDIRCQRQFIWLFGTHADWLESFKQQYNFIAASPSMNVPATNKSGSTVQTVSSTGLMLGFMVRVPTVLPFIFPSIYSSPFT